MIKKEKKDILILDDFGIQPLAIQNRMLTMEIIADRNRKKTTIITSKLPVNVWNELIGEQALADVILDRIVLDAHGLELQGEHLRKNGK